MSEVIDITPPITTGGTTGTVIAVFPGDTPPSRDVLLDIHRGDNITLSTLRTTVHVGAHADGESHYKRAGRTIDRMPLDRYLGPCQVVTPNIRRTPGGARLTVQHLRGGIDAIRRPRILFRTLTQPDRADFNTDFAALDPALVDALAERGVVTIGIDTPSVDTADSKDLPAHNAIARNGIAILEGLDLAHVDDGDYELIALPLKLAGFDGSPVRAVLRPL